MPRAVERGGMTDGDTDGGDAGADDGTDAGTDDGTERVWLVERQYDDGGMVTLVYATPDGARRYRTQFSAAYLESRSVTAARTEPAGELGPTPAADRERYREEARRVRERHAPDEEI